MEIRELRYFVAVAEELNFSRAAAKLHISQQSLSTAVAKLEARLACRLFARTTRRVELTAPGRALLAAAPAVFEAADAAVAAARAAGEVRGAPVRVRYGLDSEHVVEPLILAFARAHPALRLSVVSGVDAENLAAVRDGRADAVFAWALDGRAGDLASRRVAVEQCVLVMPAGDPLAAGDVVARSSLQGRTVVMFPRETVPGTWDLIAGALGLTDAPERMHVLPVNGQRAMVDAALELGAVCPVSESLVPGLTRSRGGVEVRPLDPPLTVPLHLAWRYPGPPAIHALAALAGAGSERTGEAILARAARM